MYAAARSSRAEVAGPGLRQPAGSSDAFLAEALAEIGDELRRRLGGSAGADPGRDGLGEPDRPGHGRFGAERRLRRQRRAAARVRRQRRRRASTTTTTPALRWSASGLSVEARAARGGAARGRLPGRVHRRARADRGRSGAGDARADRGDDGALPDPLRLVGEAERPRARAADAILPELPTYEQDGARLRPLDRVRRREGSRARPLGREGRPADLRGGRHRLPARQARARLRPRDLRARRRPSRRRRLVRGRSRGCSATTPRGSRCCSTNSCT